VLDATEITEFHWAIHPLQMENKGAKKKHTGSGLKNYLTF
jgi:hypothetical protein